MPPIWSGLQLLPGEMPPGVAGVLRTLRYGNPDFEWFGSVTFLARPSACPREQWDRWCGEIYRPILRPILWSALGYAAAERARELVATDRALDRALPAESAARSRECGRKLLRDFPPPPAARVLSRLRRGLADGEFAGHYATVFAARCALFSIGSAETAMAYVFQEWIAGTAGRVPATRAPDLAADALAGWGGSDAVLPGGGLGAKMG